MKSCIPVGPIALTIIYGAFSFGIETYAPECIHEPCSTEGVDNSIANWGSDFFVAVTMLLLALHLRRTQQQQLQQIQQQQQDSEKDEQELQDRRDFPPCPQQLIRKSGIQTQMYMALAFMLWGTAHLVFPNSSINDGKGFLGYYVTYGLAFFFATHSLLEQDRFVCEAFRHSLSDPRCCGHRFLKVFQSSSLLALLGIIIGCIWCSADPKTVSTFSLRNLNPDDGHADREGERGTATSIEDFGILDEPMCYQLIYVSEHAWYLVYALFWVASSTMLRAATVHDNTSFLFLPTSIAAACVACIQWTIGFMLLIYIGGVALIFGESVTTLRRDYYVAYVFHCGMLLTACMSHTLSCTLTIKRMSGLDGGYGGGESNSRHMYIEEGGIAIGDGLESSHSHSYDESAHAHAHANDHEVDDVATTTSQGSGFTAVADSGSGTDSGKAG